MNKNWEIRKIVQVISHIPRTKKIARAKKKKNCYYNVKFNKLCNYFKCPPNILNFFRIETTNFN